MAVTVQLEGTCDVCGNSEEFEGPAHGYQPCPKGWQRIDTGREMLLCPNCLDTPVSTVTAKALLLAKEAARELVALDAPPMQATGG